MSLSTSILVSSEEVKPQANPNVGISIFQYHTGVRCWLLQVQFNAYTVEFLFLFEIIGFAFNVRRQGLSQSGFEVEATCE